MEKIVLLLMFVTLSCPAMAQEVFFSAGVTYDTNTRNARNQWSVTYKKNLGEHAAFSFSYINGGHPINHYRDGLAAQLWGRKDLLDSRLSLALGIGPFAYADTHVVPITETFQDKHGFGVISRVVPICSRGFWREDLFDLSWPWRLIDLLLAEREAVA